MIATAKQHSNHDTGPHGGGPLDGLTLPECEARVAAWLQHLLEPGQVTELRAVKVRRRGERQHTESGFFDYDHLEDMAAAALDITPYARGVYFLMNRLRPDILARRCNRVDWADEGELAGDKAVQHRRWLLVDADPARDSLVSSTDAEKADAWEVIQAVREYLRGRGWPEPVVGDSGNGFHLLYRVDLPADDGGLMKRILQALANRFDTPAVKIDKTVFNAARICKLPGTLARKGDSTPDRPHRRSYLLEAPPLNVVATELLEELAAEAKDEATANGTPPPTANGNGSGGGHRLDVPRWLTDRGVPHRQKKGVDAKGRTAYVLAECPFDPSHRDPDSCIMQDAAGKLSAKCLHDSCAGRGWKDFKAAIGPPDDDHFDPPRRRKKQGKKVHAPAPDGKAEDGRPQIVITPEMKMVNDQAVESLACVPDLYVHGDSLARVVHDGADTRHVCRAAGAPRIVPATTATLREALSAAALWLKYSVQAEGHVQTLPPDWAAPAILGRGSWPGLPRLTGVVEAPCLRPDGTVLDRPGYDRATGLLYCPSADYPPVPQSPSKADAVRAADELLALVVDFPFEGKEHAAAWLAAVLSVPARPAVLGPCPLFLFEAPTPGCGKTLLAELVGLINTGRETSVSELSDDNEEVRKAITAILLEGERVILFDNAAGAFGCKALDAALTGTTYQGRILGQSRRTAPLPVSTVFMASGNNLVVRGDTPRRVVLSRIVPPDERPEERTGFKIPNLKDHARQNHPRLAVAALTVLHAFNLAGRPRDSELPPFGSFEAWSDFVRHAVHWVTGHDPCAARDSLRAEVRVGAADLAAVLEGWSRLEGGRDSKKGVTARQALQQCGSVAHGGLFDALLEWGEKGALPTPDALGRLLRSARDRVAGGWRLRAVKPGQNTHRTRGWFVEEVRRQGT